VVRCYYGYSLWCLVFFYSFTKGLVERYPEIYEGSGTPTQHQVNFGRKWKAYTTIYELAGGDIKKIDEVTLEPLEKCLLFLSFKADKQLLEEMMHKEAMKGIK
jgi:hypothetical protein